MKLYIIAGEASGDLHGSNLLHALRQIQPDLLCRGWGGDLMENSGIQLVKHYRDLAFMGFVEVLKNLRTILNNLDFCKKDILAFQPDALVLIDYPGFNLRIAKWANKQGIPVIYYISPQIWAWHQSRVHDIRRDVDLLLVILPFEKYFFAKHLVKAVFVGHPLLDAIGPEFRRSEDTSSKTIVLLPGSRKQEVQKILPPMLSVTPHFPDYQFVVAASQALPLSLYQEMMSTYTNVNIVQGQTYALLHEAKAALVKSGTSTLETAIIGTPQVVCYAGNPLSYAIAKRLVTIKYISLVNLILDRPLVKELIQNELNTDNLKRELNYILNHKNAAEITDGYAELRSQLGSSGASQKAAREIMAFLSAQNTAS
jgi:lipid-A-disaccharide synthase